MTGQSEEKKIQCMLLPSMFVEHFVISCSFKGQLEGARVYAEILHDFVDSTRRLIKSLDQAQIKQGVKYDAPTQLCFSLTATG
jgi:hypothetical protein